MSGLIDSLCERYSTDYQRMATALDQALAEIDRLRLENANLRTENRELRRMLQDHELRMLRRAERDALLLGALHFSGGFTSKRQVASVGMGENRWSLARVLLRFGGVLRKDGSYKAQTPGEWESGVAHAVRIVASEGGDLLRRASYRHKARRRGATNGASEGATSGASFVSKPLHYTGERGVR
jgi:hypothetical protein